MTTKKDDGLQEAFLDLIAGILAIAAPILLFAAYMWVSNAGWLGSCSQSGGTC